MPNHSLLLWLVLFLDGASGAVEVSVSVMKGDSVTLHTNLSQLQTDCKVDWTHRNGTIIAKIENNKIKKEYSAGQLKGRLKVNVTTGSLTIENITTADEGFYELDIRGKNDQKSTNFSVTVLDEIKTVTVKQGESIILRTGVIEIRGFDLIMWKFEDHCIAEISKETNQFSLYDTLDKKFGGRLHPDHQTGSLTISNSKTSDSGDYNVNMNKNTYSLQRTISVTVSGLSLALGVICVCLLLVAIALVIYYWYKLHKERQKQARGNAAVPNSDNH